MKAVWNRTTIAESNETIVIDGNHYFPPDSVNREFLTESDYTSECPWKGTAHYHNVEVEGEINKNGAWYYPVPKDGSIERVQSDFTNYVAFWQGVQVTE